MRYSQIQVVGIENRNTYMYDINQKINKAIKDCDQISCNFFYF